MEQQQQGRSCGQLLVKHVDVYCEAWNIFLRLSQTIVWQFEYTRYLLAYEHVHTCTIPPFRVSPGLSSRQTAASPKRRFLLDRPSGCFIISSSCQTGFLQSI